MCKINIISYYLIVNLLQLNPEHTVPTLVDNSFSLWESRAIIIYLVDKYAKNDALYPKDPKTRAVINQRLFFDMDTIYESFADYYYPQIFESKPADPEKFKAMEEAVGFLEIFLTGNEYVAGNTISIADFSLLASISTFDVAKFDLSSYKNVSRWYELCKKTVPGWEINWEGIQQMSTYFDKLSQ